MEEKNSTKVDSQAILQRAGNPLTLMKREIAIGWQRVSIIAICISLVLARLIWPSLAIDWITLALLAIAFLAFLLPNAEILWKSVFSLLPYVRKLKVAGVEVELSDEIRNLSHDLELAKESLVAKYKFSLEDSFELARSEVLNVLKQDPRAALLILAARIEQQVHLQLAKHGLRGKGDVVPMRQAISLGVSKGVFPKEIVRPFEEFWELRNRVSHGQAFDVETSTVLSLVSIGLEVLKLVSMEINDGSGNQE